MTDTNAFYPGGFYGVAFEHLPSELSLATAEASDVFAATALAGSLLTLAVTEPVDVLAGTVGIVAFADFAIIDSPDVLIAEVSSITHADLAVTEDFFDSFAGDASVAHIFDLNLVELPDVVEAELATTADLDLAVTETTPDVFAADVGIIAFADLAAVEDPDVLAVQAARWDFTYTDTETIRVPWEKQAIAVQGAPKGKVNRRHEYITAFNELAFYPVAFFSGSGGFDYDDNSAIVVPPAHVITERLREQRGSYVEPRARR